MSVTSVLPGYLMVGVRSVRVRVWRRTVLVCAALLVAVLVVGLLTVGLGEVRVGPVGIWHTLTGDGSTLERYTVLRLRLPRYLAALLVGAALGASGAIVQSLSRNPLGSPDIIGFTAGSSVGALLALLVLGTSVVSTATGAMVGGLVAAIAVYTLSRTGGTVGDRLIYVGLGAHALLTAVVSYLLARSELAAAQGAFVWLIGSLNAAGWPEVTFLSVSLLVLAPLALLAGRRLGYLELGDEAAQALGVRVERSRLALVALAVALSGVAVSMSGPVAFVALAAPQLAKRLTRATGPNLVAGALLGATLLSLGDLLARLTSGQLPVGVLTGALGGVYLAWLLSREWRRQTV